MKLCDVLVIANRSVKIADPSRVVNQLPIEPSFQCLMANARKPLCERRTWSAQTRRTAYQTILSRGLTNGINIDARRRGINYIEVVGRCRT